jgi:hypothetical protein
MIMKRILTGTALVGATILGVTFGAAILAEAADVGQLAASAGVSATEAEGLTLSEIAAIKFNRDTRGDDRQSVGHAQGTIMVDGARHANLIRQAGLTSQEAGSLTLSELAASKHNAGSDEDDMIVVVSSRGQGRANPQLVASAGLSPAEAQGMSLTDIAAAKFRRDTRSDD